MSGQAARTKLLVFVVLCSSTSVSAQEEELAYDDGEPRVTHSSLATGDIEVTRFTPDHPSTVTSIALHFATPSCAANIFVWPDNGGNAIDVEQVLWESSQTIEAEGWLEVALPGGVVTIDPPQHFYVGHVVDAVSPCQLSWDNSGSDDPRSQARMNGTWYSFNEGSDQFIDALVRARVQYFDVLDERNFEEVTEEEGGLPGSMNRMAWGDYDDDGDDDLLVDGNRLFRNSGDGTFDEVTEAAGIGDYPTNGGVWADYDNDGFLDFYATVTNHLPDCEDESDCVWCTLQNNPDGSRSCVEYQYDHECVDGSCMPPSGERFHDLLWHNEGDGTFTEVSDDAGRPYDYLRSEAAAWADYDGDGFVDLYVANYEAPGEWVRGARAVGTPDMLWRNTGDGFFEDTTEEAGLRPNPYHLAGRGVSWVDHDLDGDQDLYVANYRLHFNLLFNNNGDGTFDEVAFDRGVAGVNSSNAYGHSIGATWGDIDRDGDWDLFVANLAHPRFIEFSDKSMLYENQGAPDFVFVDRREAAGIAYSETHSNPAFGDYDNDGLIDMFLTDIYVGYRAFLYRNLDDLTFNDVTYPSGIVVDNGWGCAWADIDDDGRLDLVSRTLWRNRTQDAGHWLKVKLRGTDSNAAAIGAVVTATIGDTVLLRQVEGGSGTGVQNSLTLHFGLGEADIVDELVIRWPSGLEQALENVPADQTLDVTEGVEPPGEPDGGPSSDAGDGGPQTDGSLTNDADVIEAPAGDCSCHLSGAASLRSVPVAILALIGLWIWRKRWAPPEA